MEWLPQTPADFLLFAICLVLAYGLWLLLVLVHELGHLIAGSAVGLELIAFRVAFVSLDVTEGRRLRFVRRSPFSGGVQMRAKAWNASHPVLRYLAFIGGGPLASLTAAVLCQRLALRCDGWAAEIAGTAFGISALHALSSLIPQRGKRSHSDGRVLLDLLFNQPRREVLLAKLTFRARLTELRRLLAQRASMPDFVERAREQFDVLELVSSSSNEPPLAGVFAHLREARRHLDAAGTLDLSAQRTSEVAAFVVGGTPTDQPWRQALINVIREQARPVDKYGHQPRLYELTRTIGAGLAYDDDIVFAAVWLHDLGVFVGHRPEEPETLARWDNTAYAVAQTPAILARVGFPQDKVAAVLDCIQQHQPAADPTTIEATILRDADILEQLGAIGLLRTVAKIGRDTRFHTFTDASTALRRASVRLPLLIHLPRARVLADERATALSTFLQELEREAGEHLH